MAGLCRFFSLVSLGWMLISVQVFAHPVEPCRATLAQLAVTLKECELAQSEKGQCARPKQSLERQVAKCEHMQFTGEAINSAVDYGYASLEGDVGQSPYRRELRKQRWENSLMKPNVLQFNQYFPDFSHNQESVMELFNLPACPKQYLGQPERMLYYGATQIGRYSDLADGETSTRIYTVHWFQGEKKGQCYQPVGDAGADAPKVVNLPANMLVELRKVENTRAVLCKTEHCTAEQTELADLYERYQKQYRLHRQLLICSDIDQRNENRKSIKGMRRPAFSLPDYCPEEEIQVQALNAKGLLDQLEQSLFQGVTISFQTVKSE